MTPPSAQALGADITVDTPAFAEGDKVWWSYASCKAFARKQIPAVVLYTCKARVRIEFAQWVREEWVREVRTVAYSNLSLRDETCRGIDTFHPSRSPSLAA
ncbi:hypothetical protein [Pseudomonas amygdali]|uniref:Uncharacterized protein n=1 Tax=Pseudomonas amygdali pv. lachrymans str. M301315 TaxID=629260 RepID=A0AAD0PW92_PSEAV|nr:hypothetical protein [Pseudomonas amygdali]AXH59914.1 hypothetical protein PLA107_032325 [Pseudomonas amygdali pv. lachrymans str. M301315]